MKEGTRKFLVPALVLLLAFSVVAAPFLAIEKVNAQEGGSWAKMSDVPIEISTSQGDRVSVVNGKIYVIGKSFNYEYDPETDTFQA